MYVHMYIHIYCLCAESIIIIQGRKKNNLGLLKIIVRTAAFTAKRIIIVVIAANFNGIVQIGS